MQNFVGYYRKLFAMVYTALLWEMISSRFSSFRGKSKLLDQSQKKFPSVSGLSPERISKCRGFMLVFGFY